MGNVCGAPKTKNVLIVATSATSLGGAENGNGSNGSWFAGCGTPKKAHPTGAWSEEISGPLYIFRDAGYTVEVCSIAGGDVPIDQGSLSKDSKTENDTRMENEDWKPIKGTRALADVDVTMYDIVFFAGGHGTCVDFVTEEVGAVVAKALAANKVVAAVCHGSNAFVNAKAEDGTSIVRGKKVACFTNEEEEIVKLADKVPFLLETKLTQLGAEVIKKEAWAVHAVQDGRLVTGQNPQSSVAAAKICLTYP